MMEAGNLVLEHLRAIRGGMAKLADRIGALAAETAAFRRHIAGMTTLQDRDRADVAAIKLRLDRIERRLEPVE